MDRVASRSGNLVSDPSLVGYKRGMEGSELLQSMEIDGMGMVLKKVKSVDALETIAVVDQHVAGPTERALGES